MSKSKPKKRELAGSPSAQTKSPSGVPKHHYSAETDLSKVVDGDKFRDWVVNQLQSGVKVPDMARKLAKGDDKRRKYLRRKIWQIVRSDPRTTLKIHEAAKGVAQAGLLPAVDALADRASRGRPDAVKPLMAVTKFHDPSVKHEHSGEIKVSIDMPRPVRVKQPDELEEPIIDAEVVEE